jgi:hypothetical protein
MRFSCFNFGSMSPAWLAMSVSAFGIFGRVLMSSTTLYLMEQYTCRDYYTLSDPSTVEMLGREPIDESLCKEPDIQSVVAGMYGTYSLIVFIPG